MGVGTVLEVEGGSESRRREMRLTTVVEQGTQPAEIDQHVQFLSYADFLVRNGSNRRRSYMLSEK
jgi:hypothetical protein